MDLAHTVVGASKDLDQLYEEGAADAVLARCPALLKLEPVMLATHGGASAGLALRCLLEDAARQALAVSDIDAVMGGALAGIQPHSEGVGIRGKPGRGGRRKNAIEQLKKMRRKTNEGLRGESESAVSDRTVMRNLDDYLTAFASVVISRAGVVARNADLMSVYLATCGVSQVGETEVRRSVASPTDRALVDALARILPLSGVLQESLDRLRATCHRDGRRVYTPDLLIALLDLPGGRVGPCFDVIQMDLSLEVRAWLARHRARLADRAEPYQPFEWAERQEVRRAKSLAYDDGLAYITELHLLLAILDGPSTTVARLKSRLGNNFHLVRDRAVALRSTLPETLRTPGPFTATVTSGEAP